MNIFESQEIKTRAGENYLTESEERRFFAILKRARGKKASRDYVFFKLCRATGLRRTEMCRLDVGDVREKTKLTVDAWIAVKKSVGDVYLSQEIQDLIRKYLRQKKYWGESISDDAPLFVSKKGGRLGIRTVNGLMAEWCKKAGLPDYTPHAFRHTKAHRIMDDVRFFGPEQQKDRLLLVKKQLRHKAINSTMIYTQPTKEMMETVAYI